MEEYLSSYLYSRNGVYYFCRRVPEDLKSNYKHNKIALSLRTRNVKAARIKAASLASQLDEDWLTLRWRSNGTPLRRFLRNQSVEARIIPLVGASLWAAERAYKRSENNFLFLRYCSDNENKANSASAALNKWLRPKVPNGCVIHSFRHSIRDRLRAVECPQDITDRLGGWTVSGVGEGYGSGYPLEVLYKWLDRAVKI